MGDSLARLCRWNTWANGNVETTLAAANGPAAALAAFQHIMEAEAVWLRRIDGDGQPMIPLWGEPELAKARAWAAEAAGRLAALAYRLETGAADDSFT